MTIDIRSRHQVDVVTGLWGMYGAFSPSDSIFQYFPQRLQLKCCKSSGTYNDGICVWSCFCLFFDTFSCFKRLRNVCPNLWAAWFGRTTSTHVNPLQITDTKCSIWIEMIPWWDLYVRPQQHITYSWHKSVGNSGAIRWSFILNPFLHFNEWSRMELADPVWTNWCAFDCILVFLELCIQLNSHITEIKATSKKVRQRKSYIKNIYSFKLWMFPNRGS